jgi:hypothetical protein
MLTLVALIDETPGQFHLKYILRKDLPMAIKTSTLLPCATFFARGQAALGVVALLMQLSLVLWPVAARWAGKTTDAGSVDRMLAELSETHKIPVGHIQPKKRFTQTA